MALRKARNEQLDAIFRTLPFYDGWFGSNSHIFGIVCRDDNPALKEVMKTKGYKFEYLSGETLIKPDKRYKAGKELHKKLQKCWQILQNAPDFSKYSLIELDVYAMVFGVTSIYFSVAGIYGENYIAKIPVRDDKYGGDKFPEIPDCLTEIKESEFLVLQGK